MEDKHGKEHYNYVPESYILPEEFNDFYRAFQ